MLRRQLEEAKGEKGRLLASHSWSQWGWQQPTLPSPQPPPQLPGLGSP